LNKSKADIESKEEKKQISKTEECLNAIKIAMKRL